MKISYGFIIEIIDGVREWLLEIKDCLNFIANPDDFFKYFPFGQLVLSFKKCSASIPLLICRKLFA